MTNPFVMVNRVNIYTLFIGSTPVLARNPTRPARQIAIYPGGTLLSPSDMEELYDKGRAWAAGYLDIFGHASQLGTNFPKTNP